MQLSDFEYVVLSESEGDGAVSGLEERLCAQSLERRGLVRLEDAGNADNPEEVVAWITDKGRLALKRHRQGRYEVPLRRPVGF